MSNRFFHIDINRENIYWRRKMESKEHKHVLLREICLGLNTAGTISP